VPAEQTGVASGMNANIRTIGGAVGSAIGASILASGVTAAHPFPQDSGYTDVFWMLTAGGVLAAVASLLIPTVRRTPRMVAAGDSADNRRTDVNEASLNG
jgi:hypothetical protein